jgi:hypothetical protein
VWSPTNLLQLQSLFRVWWGTSLPPLSAGACCTLATVANLAHPKLPGGVAKPAFSGKLIYLQFVDACPSFSGAQGALPSLLSVFFNSLLFFYGEEDSLSRGLCWFIPGVAVGIPCAAYLITCWSVSPKQVRSWHLAA